MRARSWAGWRRASARRCSRKCLRAGDGNLVSGSLLDYLLPTATDVPDFDLELAEIPCTTNPLGVKGVGESGTIGAPPTVINAMIDALRPLGVTDLSMPASPMRVWQAIENARVVGK